MLLLTPNANMSQRMLSFTFVLCRDTDTATAETHDNNSGKEYIDVSPSDSSSSPMQDETEAAPPIAGMLGQSALFVDIACCVELACCCDAIRSHIDWCQASVCPQECLLLWPHSCWQVYWCSTGGKCLSHSNRPVGGSDGPRFVQLQLLHCTYSTTLLL